MKRQKGNTRRKGEDALAFLLLCFMVPALSWSQSSSQGGPSGADQILTSIYDSKTNSIRVSGSNNGGTVSSVGLSMPSEFGDRQPCDFNRNADGQLGTAFKHHTRWDRAIKCRGRFQCAGAADLGRWIDLRNRYKHLREPLIGCERPVLAVQWNHPGVGRVRFG